MKLRLPFFGSLALILLFNQCSNDFDLTAPWKDIPVVYGILSPKDEVHYIRIEKAFLDPERSALVIADNPDSLYYPENAIAVFLKKKGSNTSYQLTRVDGNLEGITRDTGIFADSPNWLYKINDADIPGGLGGDETWQLVIKRADGSPDITAETTIPDDFFLTSPDLASTPPFIGFLTGKNTTISWLHDENAVLFDITFRIRYREEKGNGALIRRDTLTWNAGKNVLFRLPTGTNFEIGGTDFYSFLNQNIPHGNVPQADTFRFFERFDILIAGGGREIREFQLAAAANSGVTGAEIVQTYTNMSEGYGIFSSKNTSEYVGFKISDATLDSMEIHPLTRLLNFPAP